jgi:hypothetical protein
MWVYIWAEGQEWQPWANTIAWYPLDSTDELSDMKWSGTAYDLTATWWTPTYSTHYATLDGSTHLQSNLASMSWASTISFSWWVNFASFSSKNMWIFIVGSNSFNWAIALAVEPSGDLIVSDYWSWPSASTLIYLQTNTWYNIWLSYASWTWRLYMNWQLDSNYNWTHTTSADLTKFSISWYQNNTERLPSGTKIWSIAVQNNEMSAQDFRDFYNGTKANYWL